MIQEAYKLVIQSYLDKVRKAKARLELNLAIDVKSDKKILYMYMNSKRKTKYQCRKLEEDDTKDEYTQCLVFPSKTGLQKSQFHKPEFKTEERKTY